LRSRRAALSPSEVGLPAVKGRRVQGLRREDVAELAEISVGWYGQFEVGRATHVSPQTVDTIGRVLQLGATEMAYLKRLSGVEDSSGPVGVAQQIAIGAAEHVLRTFTGGPAHVMDRYYNVVAVNEIARTMLTIEPGSNIARKLFYNEHRRRLFPDWDVVAARFVAGARLRYPSMVDDPQYEALIAELRAESEEFARLWDAGDLGSPYGEVVRVAPEGGPIITLTWAIFPLPDTDHVMVLSPAVDPESQARMQAVLAALAGANAH
ncbi:MAG TPA: helix-turn-helix transcriptional regulator, partial [Candidatus Limnocylindrales bacterium]|nr:helix-turn-helix transcriptional regulator [Candidatus Limnocylindrales bacterium]